MTTALKPRRKTTKALTLADLMTRFGPMPSWRIRTIPPPGLATEKDLLRIHEREDRLCELVDGILVEKDVGCDESELSLWLGKFLADFVVPRRLGRLTGSDGPMRLEIGLVRIPDIAFVARNRFPEGKRPSGAISTVVPNLAIEVLSRGNTPQEMRRKLREYFKAGVELVWFVDPRNRTVEVFTGPDKSTILTERQSLTGGHVLPGFKLKLRELFAILDE